MALSSPIDGSKAGELDLRMLAHVLNDPDLSGTPLEGASLLNTASYFHHFLSQINSGEITLPGITAQQQAELKKQSQLMQNLFIPFINIITTMKDAPDKKKALEQVALDAAQELHINKRLLIPGGWLGIYGGHAMIYEFKYDDNGDLLFLVWNSGSGLRNHIHQETQDGHIFSNVKAYRIPKKNTQSPNLAKFIEDLLKPDHTEHNKHNADTIYNQILPKVAFLGGKEIDPTPFIKSMGPGQYSGTCALQVIAELIKNYVFKGLNFEQIYYQFILATLENFTKKLNDAQWQQPDNISQLGLACKNLAHYTQSFATANLIDQTSQLKGLALIKTINAKISANPPPAKTNVQQFESTWWENDTQSKIDLKTERGNVTLKAPKPLSDDLIHAAFDAQLHLHRPLGENFTAAMEFISKRLATPIELATKLNEQQLIEQFLLELPITKEFWKTRSRDELFAFTESLTKLTKRYCLLSKEIDGHSFAERHVAVHSAIIVAECIADVLFEKNKTVLKVLRSTYESEYDKFATHYNKAQNNPYFVIADQKVANRSQQLQKIFEEHFATKSYTIDLMSTIANSDPALKALALQENFSKPYPKKLKSAIYYTQKRQAGLENIQNKFPEIEKQSQFCLSLCTLRAFGSAVSNDKDTGINGIFTNNFFSNDWSSVTVVEYTNTDPAYRFAILVRPSICTPDAKKPLKCAYNLSDTYRADLKKKRLPANNIQINIRQAHLSDLIDKRRQLTHIRSNAKSQSIAAIEFIQNNLSNFADVDVLKVATIHLFQGGHLATEISNNPQAIVCLAECITKGLKYYQDKKYLLQFNQFHLINTLLHQYIVSALKTTPASDQLKQVLHSLDTNHLTATAFAPHFEMSTMTLSYHYELIYLQSRHAQNDQLTTQEWARFFTINYAINKLKNSSIDEGLLKESAKARDQLRALARCAPLDIPAMLSAILTASKCAAIPQGWKGKYPHFALNDHHIDLQLGLVTLNHFKNVTLPLKIIQNRLFIGIFGSNNPLGDQIDSDTYLVHYENENYKIQVVDDQTIVIFKEFTINNDKKWYQLNTDIAHLIKDFNTKDTSTAFLPHTLVDKQKLVWSSDKGDLVISDLKKKPLCFYQKEQQSLLRLNEQQQFQWKLLKLPKQMQFLENFEDPRFIEIWADQFTGQLQISLPRYGLDFRSEIKDNQTIFVWQKNKEYQLLPQNSDVIPNLKANLVLAPINNKSVGDHNLYLIPKQSFIATNKKEDDFYKYKLDIANETTIAANYQKDCFDINIDQYPELKDLYNQFIAQRDKLNGEIKTPSQCQNAPYLHIFKDQEKYATLNITAKGDLTAHSIADQLYLANVYLAKHQPGQALTILKSLLHSFSGSHEECDYLHRIITNTATPLINPGEQKANKNEGPVYCAVRATALVIYANFVKKGGVVNLEKNQGHIQGRFNSYAALVNSEKLKEFFNKGSDSGTIASHVRDILANYFEIKKFIPKSMRLTSNDLMGLINIAKKSKVPLSLSLKTFARRKQIKLWLKEYQNLKAIEATITNGVQGGLNTTQQARLDRLHKLLGQKYTLHPQTSRISETSFATFMQAFNKEDKKESMNLGLAQQIGGVNLILRSRVANHLRINDLHANVDLKLIQSNLIFLFQEAIHDEKKNKLLQDFLNHKIRSIISCLKSIDPNQLLSLLLLRVMLANPEKANKIIRTFAHNKENSGLFRIFRRKRSFDETLFDAFAKEMLNYQNIVHLSNDDPNNAIVFTPKINPTIVVPAAIAASNIAIFPTTRQLLEKSNQGALFTPVVASSINTQPVFTPTATDGTPFMSSIATEQNQDYAAGIQINQQIKNNDLHYQTLLAPNEVQHNLLAQINDTLNANKAAFAQLRANILNVINKGPSALQESIRWECGILAQSTKKLSMENVLHYFANMQLSSLEKKRQVSSPELNNLQAMIFGYLLEKSKRQQLVRSKVLLEELARIPVHDDINKKSVLSKLGRTLTAQRCYDPALYPTILLLETKKDILLFPEQFALFCKFMKKAPDNAFTPIQAQLKMGMGKSKVLNPLLGKNRATGTNLNLIEVPQALFETNFNDLKAESKKTYGQNAYPFLFHRNMVCDSAYFHQLKKDFKQVIANKDYVVSVKNSADSLALKYIDILTNPIEDLKEWEKQIQYVDEIDSSLKPKEQLIYTVDEGKSVEKSTLAAILNLYLFFEHIPVANIPEHPQANFGQVVFGTIARPQEAMVRSLIQDSITALFSSDKSPIKAIVDKITAENRMALLKFLQNQHDVIPAFLYNLSSSERNILGIYKEQLSKLLPLTLAKNQHEHYGLPKDCPPDSIDQEIAIPYSGNNTPCKNSKFQNHFVTLNYTIQIQLGKDLSAFLFKRFLHTFISRREIEKSLNAYKSTPTHQMLTEFKQLVGDINLDEIDLENKDQIAQLHQQIKNNQNVKCFCLNEYVLPAILSNPETLSANTQNHVDLFRSASGFTGSDYNYRTFHPSIVRDSLESFGTDGQTLDHLLKDQQNTVKVLENNGYQALFDLLDKHPNNNVRSIIDTGALFKGIPNRDVANVLAAQLFKKPNNTCKHILYFNDQEVLCALKASNNPDQETPFILGTSENIAQRLDCKADEYFTYYSQKQTTGIDIKQALNTVGLVTVSEHSTLRDVLQGANRLRELDGSHRAELVVMHSLAKANPAIQAWDVKQILNTTLATQTSVLMKEHLSAAFQQMHDTFRSDLFHRIRTAKTIMEKVVLANAFRSFLYDKDDASLFEKFASPEKMVPTETLLQAHHNQLLTRWKNCIQLANITPPPAIEQQLCARNKAIQEKLSPLCEKLQNTPLSQGLENQVIAQREVQIEKEQQQYAQDGNKLPARYNSWNSVFWWFYNPDYEFFTALDPCRPLEKIVASNDKPRSWTFSKNITVSSNFYTTTSNYTDNKLNTFKKPCYYTLAIYNGRTLQQQIITHEEAAEIRTLWEKNPFKRGRKMWIETPGGIPFCGEKPKDIEKLPQYQEQMEQIQYFNGDVSYLTANAKSSVWLKDKAKEKLEFLENNIMVYHPSKSALLPILKNQFADAAANDHTHISKPKDNIKRDPHLDRLRLLYSVGLASTLGSDQIKYLLQYVNQRYTPGSIFNSLRIAKVLVHNWIEAKVRWFASSVVSLWRRFRALSVLPKRYDNIDKINNIQSAAELTALKDGVKSLSPIGYACSYFHLASYTHYKTYCEGRWIRLLPRQSVLVDEIKRASPVKP